MDNLAAAGFGPFKISVVVTRAERRASSTRWRPSPTRYGAQLRLTRLRPSGRAVDTWDALHPTAAQQRTLYHWLRRAARGADRRLLLPPLGARASRSTGSTCAAPGRVVCLIDPVGDVYACPFVIDRQFLAGNVRDAGRLRRGLARLGAVRRRCASRRAPGACASCGSYDACQGGCMAAKFFTGLPLDGPDPECVHGHGEAALAALGERPQRSSGTPRSAGTGRPSRCPRRCASARRPAPDAAWSSAGATWPEVEATGGRDGAGGAARLARAARAAPAARHRHPDRRGRWRPGWRRAAPTWRWRPPSPTGPAASTPASRARCWWATQVAGRPPGRAGALGPRRVRRRRVRQRPRRQRRGACRACRRAVRGRGRRRAGRGAAAPPAATPTPGGPRRR